MKNYELKYINLFRDVEKPNTKVLEVLVELDDRFTVLQVFVEYNKKDDTHPWFIKGDREFNNLTTSELDDFIDKLKTVEPYFMSEYDYEIIDIKSKSRGNNMCVAVAHDDGHFSIVNLISTGENKYSFKTDWEYLTDHTIDRFVNKSLSFINDR